MFFDKPGKDNTEQTLKLAFERRKELGLNEAVLASPKGVGPHGIAAVIIGFLICLFIGFTMKNKTT